MYDKAIKALREEKKLTQLQLASILGCSVTLVSRWENGKVTPIRYKSKFENLFGKDIFLRMLSTQ